MENFHPELAKTFIQFSSFTFSFLFLLYFFTEEQKLFLPIFSMFIETQQEQLAEFQQGASLFTREIFFQFKMKIINKYKKKLK